MSENRKFGFSLRKGKREAKTNVQSIPSQEAFGLFPFPERAGNVEKPKFGPDARSVELVECSLIARLK